MNSSDHRNSSGSKPSATPAVRRVLKAYEQVSDQLRDLIMSGELTPGTRLPSEHVLAAEFGVSRATIREALRALSAQKLIATTKGTTGGSFVTLPTVDHLSQFMKANMTLLSQAREVALEEFFQVREMLEVPAARLAAAHRQQAHIDRLRESIPFMGATDADDEMALRSEQFNHNRAFHSIVVEAAGNTILYVAVQPIFSVMRDALSRSTLSKGFHSSINAHHRRIADAIADGDEAGAESEMRSHLEFLRPEYERIWKRSMSGGKRRK